MESLDEVLDEGSPLDQEFQELTSASLRQRIPVL